MSKIEWTNKTWNPLAGCSKVSKGCENCYAMHMANRIANIGGTKKKYAGTTQKSKSAKFQWTGQVNFDEKALLEPLKRKKPIMYFVNSMSDLFYEDVKKEWIDKIFAVMALTPQHTYQILTKRPERMKEYVKGLEIIELQDIAFELLIEAKKENNLPQGWLYDYYTDDDEYKEFHLIYEGPEILPNVWLGVSVENQKTANERIPYLLETPANIRFVSAEPLLGAVDFRNVPVEKGSPNLDWVIVGGESGKNARPMHPDWIRSIQQQCKKAATAFFFKQWGSNLPLTQTDLLIDADFHLNEYGEKDMFTSQRGCYVGFAKVGKKKAGNLLDGVLKH